MTATIRAAEIGDEELLAKLNRFVQDVHLVQRSDHFRPTQAPPNPFCRARRWCEIDQIAVDPKYRRRGIGRSLILKAIAEARTEGIRDIEATSWSFNEETHEMFRRLGFSPKTVRFERKSSITSESF